MQFPTSAVEVELWTEVALPLTPTIAQASSSVTSGKTTLQLRCTGSALWVIFGIKVVWSVMKLATLSARKVRIGDDGW
jgi:hypothetical protein